MRERETTLGMLTHYDLRKRVRLGDVEGVLTRIVQTGDSTETVIRGSSIYLDTSPPDTSVVVYEGGGP